MHLWINHKTLQNLKFDGGGWKIFIYYLIFSYFNLSLGYILKGGLRTQVYY